MKFSAVVALRATTQAIQLKSKTATKGENDIVLTVDGDALMEVMEQLDTLAGQIEALAANPVFEQALMPVIDAAEPELMAAGEQISTNE